MEYRSKIEKGKGNRRSLKLKNKKVFIILTAIPSTLVATKLGRTYQPKITRRGDIKELRIEEE